MWKLISFNITFNRQIVLIALCMLLAPLFQLTGDAVFVIGDHKLAWTIWRAIACIFFIPVFFSLMHWLKAQAAALGTIALLFGVVGSMGVFSMLNIYRVDAVLHEGAPGIPSMIEEAAGKNSFIAIAFFIPGLCFPVSLLLFGIGILKAKILTPAIGMLLIISALLFWLGNAGALKIALLPGDILLATAFALITSKLNTADVWSTRPVIIYESKRQEKINRSVGDN